MNFKGSLAVNLRKGTGRMEKLATMDLTYIQGETFREFVINNMSQIMNEWNYTGGKFKFFQSAKATPNSLQETFENLFLIIGREKPNINMNELANWAQEIGRKRAKTDFPIYYTLELFHEFRDLFWKTLYSYLKRSGKDLESDDIFELERYYNQLIDTVIYHFACDYVKQRNQIIRLQQLAVKTPKVPLVSLTEDVGLLTLIGSMDSSRLENWTDEIINNVEKHQLATLIIDISQVYFTDHQVLKAFLHAIQGFGWIGCRAILTGLNYKDGKELIKEGTLPEGITIYSTVKQAISSLRGLSGPSNGETKKRTMRKVNRRRQ